MKIFKYRLALTETQVIEIPPVSSRFLSVQLQEGKITLWVMVDDTAPRRPRHIHIYATGSPCDGAIDCHYIGTVQHFQYVWHVFGEIL